MIFLNFELILTDAPSNQILIKKKSVGILIYSQTARLIRDPKVVYFRSPIANLIIARLEPFLYDLYLIPQNILRQLFLDSYIIIFISIFIHENGDWTLYFEYVHSIKRVTNFEIFVKYHYGILILNSTHISKYHSLFFITLFLQLFQPP